LGSSSGIKSLTDVVQSLLAEILRRQPGANLTIGTFNRDILVDAPAGEIALLYSQVSVAQQAQSISLAVGDHLDRLLANYTLYRRESTKATGSCYFRTITAPSSDIIIPVGTIIRTSQSLTQDAIEYTTTSTVTMISSQINTYYNSDDDVYEVQAPIQAILAGTNSNIGPNTLLDIVPTMTIVTVLNKTATSGGTEAETDDAFRARGLSVLIGSNVGTKAGYEILIENITGVHSVVVIDPNDTEMERVKDGGGADVWIYEDNGLEKTDTYTYHTGELYHILLFKPVKSISAVTVNGILLVPGIDYSLVRDTGVYERSIYSTDKIVWITTRTDSDTIVITYKYSDIVQTAQGYLDNTQNHIVGVEVIAKLCFTATVNVTMVVEMLSGYDPVSVTSLVNSQIVEYINALPVGNEIQQSDIIGIAEDTAGVDSVVLPLTKFTVTREISGLEDDPDEIENVSTILTDGTATGNLILRKYEFATAASSNVIVTSYQH
jgi:hypothetical protein